MKRQMRCIAALVMAITMIICVLPVFANDSDAIEDKRCITEDTENITGDEGYITVDEGHAAGQAAGTDNPSVPATVDSPPVPAAVDSLSVPAAVESPPVSATADNPSVPAAVDNPSVSAADYPAAIVEEMSAETFSCTETKTSAESFSESESSLTENANPSDETTEPAETESAETDETTKTSESGSSDEDENDLELQAVIDSGTFEQDLTWTMDSNGILTISGTGQTNGNIPYEFRDSIKYAVIYDGMTAIGEDTFCYCCVLPCITIPGTVKSIYYSAFLGCDSLTDIFYMGTEDEWNAIYVEGGELILNATVHCLGDGNIIHTGWNEIDGKTYFFYYGNPIVGWMMLSEADGEKWYHMDSDGVMQTGWIIDEGLCYYLDPSTGIMQKGLIYDGNAYYYINPETGELILGDMMLSVPRALQQAEEYGHSVFREYAFLIAHSMLHLAGYDHMEKEERVQMETMQEEIMNKLGITRE